MKKHSMPEMKEGGVNVTPLIDIVMCLIIFFMLVTKIGVSRGIDKSIQLPDATLILGKKIEDIGNTLSLNIHPQVGVPLPQVTTSVDNVIKEIKIVDPVTKQEQLATVLRDFKKIHGDKAKVIIRADKDLQYGQLEQVLMVVSTAQITDMAYEAKTGKDKDAGDQSPPAEAAAQ